MSEHHHDSNRHESLEEQGGPSETRKVTRMVEHWVHHNEDHARSYRDWAARLREIGQEEAGLILERVADQVLLQNQDLQKILTLLRP